MNEILIEIHKAKIIANCLNELEGIIRILGISDVIKDNMMIRIKNIKESLKNAKIKEEVK